MITLPKPKFAETNVPLGLSQEEREEYFEDLMDMQSHGISNAIDRVSYLNLYDEHFNLTAPHWDGIYMVAIIFIAETKCTCNKINDWN